jgi:Mannosyltransferase (PIG-V)
MRASPFWTLVWIRVAFWIGTAATLLWAPRSGAADAPARAWDPFTDLLFGTFAQWDARWFLVIARSGYDETSAAFFPLYPLLLWALGSSLVWGTLLSLAAAGLGAYLIHEIARPKLGEEGARDTVLVLALFPTAFVFTAVYSDGLFLMLSAASFLAAERGRPWAAGLAGGLAVATRSLGLALLPALVYLLWPRRGRRDAWRLAPLLLLPAAVGLYALYLEREVGDAWALSESQASSWNRELATFGPLSGIWMAVEAGGHGALDILRDLPRTDLGGAGYPQPLQVGFWNAVHLLALVPVAWLTYVEWRRLGPALGLYALTTLVVILSVPSEGFPLVSMPRFVLTDFPVLIALAAVLRERPSLRTGVLVALGALSAAAGVAFSRGTWVA